MKIQKCRSGFDGCCIKRHNFYIEKKKCTKPKCITRRQFS